MRHKLGFFLVGGLLAIFAGTVSAHSDLDDYFLTTLRDAAYQYPQTRSAEKNMDAANSEKESARWQRYPSPSVISQSPRNTSTDQSLNQTINAVAVSQPIWEGGSIDAGIAQADAQFESSRANYEYVAQDRAIQTASTWYDWKRNVAREAVLQESLIAHQKLEEQIKRRVAEGVSAQADLTLAMARLSSTRSDLAQAQSAVRTSYAQLTQLAGPYLSKFTSDSLGIAANKDVQTPPPAAWRDAAMSRDPQLQKLKYDADTAAAQIDVQRSKAYPMVSMRVEHDFSGPTKGQGVFLQVQAQPGAGLSYESNVKAAEARRESAEDSQHDAELDLARNLDSDFATYASSRDQLEVAELLRSSTQSVAESYARQFVAGHKSWLDVLNAVQEAVSARLTILDAQANMGESWWRLRLRALGLGSSAGSGL
jgi:adhesin transport system outer membrane protein